MGSCGKTHFDELERMHVYACARAAKIIYGLLDWYTPSDKVLAHANRFFDLYESGCYCWLINVLMELLRSLSINILRTMPGNTIYVGHWPLRYRFRNWPPLQIYLLQINKLFELSGCANTGANKNKPKEKYSFVDNLDFWFKCKYV